MALLQFFFSFFTVPFNLWKSVVRLRGLEGVRKKIIGKSAGLQAAEGFTSLRGDRQWLGVIQRHSFEKVTC